MTIETSNGFYEYYFRKNIFGDIVGVYDPTKGLLATYTYDAFGNSVVEYTNTSNNKAYLNPFRYRGYYWDDELELYYLQSRYYDPEIGRFISPDSIENINQNAIFGLNLYAYCNNNPIMNVDPTGKFVLTSFLIGLAIFAALGAAAGALSYVGSELISFAFTGEWSWSWGMFLGSVIGGAIGGALSFAFPGMGVVLGGFVTGSISTAIGMGLENAFGEAEHSALDILIYSIADGLLSAGVANITSFVKIPGVTGRGSVSQVYKQIATKFYNGTIRRIASKTLIKMTMYEAINNFFGMIFNGINNIIYYYRFGEE